jgi:hypothetical protein
MQDSFVIKSGTDRYNAGFVAGILRKNGLNVNTRCPVKCRYPDGCKHWEIFAWDEKTRDKARQFIDNFNF